ncbi:restriction endonuclease subunit S [Lactobacillus iners]|uniref:restriction endonuclease subunit S n=1 Tax=Lactobacillus iners TaxID=147802 RepID=UPI001E35F5D6|nr:restriction endonuclease subunit S [Lactobacillus iners]MCT7703127.1 restriction endonuclease subunit S [Lactobacillus iners]
MLNKNLEQQARSLFKAWFVDFDPFANTMLSDWKKGKLKDILKLKRQSIKTGENTTLPYLPIDVIPMRTFALTDFKPNAEAQSSLITFDKDDIIIGAMRVYFHRVVLAPCDGITRTTCFTLAPYNNEYLSFALLCCDQESSIDYAQSTSKGSTMPYAIWEGGLGDMEIIIPTPEIAKKFNEIVLPMLRQIQNSYFENNRLREIRNALLPRLMSDEVDVSNLDL